MEKKNKLITEMRAYINKHKDDTPADRYCLLKYPPPGKSEFTDDTWVVYSWSQELRDELEKVLVSLLSDEADFNKSLELVLATFFKYKVNVWNEDREFDRQRWSK